MANQQPPTDTADTASAPATSKTKPAPEVEMVTLRISDVQHHAVVLHGPAESDYPEGRPYTVTPEGTQVPADLAQEFMHNAGRAGVSLANATQEQADQAELEAREGDAK